MDSSALQKYKTLFLQLVFGLGIVLLGLKSVSSSMTGGAARLKLVVGGVLAIVSVLVLKNRYWMLFPFFLGFDYRLPGLPFDGLELSCVSVVGVWIVRSVLHRENRFSFDRQMLLPTLFFCWVAFVFLLNPPGLNILGSKTIGGRSYFQIALGFFALLAMSTWRFSERDGRLFFWTLVVSSGANALLCGVVNPVSAMGAGGEFEGGYFLLTFVPLYYLMFARYSLSAIVNSLPRLMAVAFLALLLIVSGKRRMLGAIALIPFFRTLLTKRDAFLVALAAMLAGIAMAVAVSADGVLFDLPEGARRTLSPVVPRYVAEGQMGLNDPFRETIRAYGREVIRDNPWFGRKGFALDREETAWLVFGTTQAGALTYAMTGSWHSTWYSYACDFGLPCMVLWALFSIQVLRYSFRSARIVTQGVYLPACCLYFIFDLFVELAFSYTSGHSARTTLYFLSRFGCLLALVRGYERERGLPET